MLSFEEILATYKSDIDRIIRRFRGRRENRSWRLEYEDLWQEACLAIWQAYPELERARDVRAYLLKCVAVHLDEQIARQRRDPLFNAVSLDQLEGYGMDIDEEGKPVMANPPQAPTVGG